ncbi:MAG: hypothetical protein KatS3mg105_0896 [Gemmatales bacterium]|nr:MAG: hypothetical protein KatS3mg105_0896 [Gemmatales bacterium]
MSAAKLPDDPKSWPDDPFQLLGVDFETDPRDIRRAYTRLIRRFKPEQYPEQFRIIREAYDIVLMHIGYLRQVQGQLSLTSNEESPDIDKATSSNEDRLAEPAKSEPVDSAPPPPLRDSHVSDEFERIWEEVCDGHPDTAYRRLLHLYEKHQEYEPIVLALYWLLKLFPWVDADGRRPLQWLLSGLSRNSPNDVLGELYRREVDADPEANLGPLFEQLPDDHLTANVDFLCRSRWQAAADVELWHVIYFDIETLRPRVASQNQILWAFLLVLAIDYLAWSDHRNAIHWTKMYVKEIDSLPDVHIPLGADLDRLELLLHLSAHWRVLWNRENNRFLRLIRQSWTRSLDEIQPLFWSVLQEIADKPYECDSWFRSIQLEAPTVLLQFGHVLRTQQAWENRPPYENENERSVLAQRVLQFVNHIKLDSYSRVRLLVLEFCLREHLDADTIGELIDASARGDDYLLVHDRVFLSNAIWEDLPLRCVCLANRLFWS